MAVSTMVAAHKQAQQGKQPWLQQNKQSKQNFKKHLMTKM